MAGHKLPKLHVGPIHAAVAGRTDHLPMRVPNQSYVLPADTVSHLGEGNTLAGFKILRRVFSGTPYGAGSAPYGQSSGPYGEPLAHASGGEADGEDDGVPIVAAGGEFVVAPRDVAGIAGGDMELGHRALDEMVKRIRADTVKTLQNLPGPKTS